MANRSQLSIGGWSAIVGALLAFVANALHPQGATADELLGDTASFKLWTLLHFGIIVAAILILIGLATLAQSFITERAAALSKVAFVIAQIGAVVLIVGISIDGFASKKLADGWVAATQADKASAYQLAIAVDQIQGGLFAMWVLLIFGLPFLLFGLAILTGDGYPRWLGAIAVLGGIACSIFGTKQFLDATPNTPFTLLFLAGSTALILWTLVLGILMTRRARLLPAVQR